MKKMKHNILSLALSAAVCLPFAGCSLDEDTSSLYTPENYFASKAECQSAINACYTSIKSIYTYTYFLATECCTDIIYCPSGTLDARLDISPAIPRFGQTVWTQGYLGIQRCNFAIAGIEASSAISDEDRVELLCEAKTLRGFYYLTLTSFFGNCPFYFDDVVDNAVMQKIARLPRMDASATRDSIIVDLQKIAPQASQTRTSDNDGHRLGAACAYMVIAKCAMWNKKWETALDALKEIEAIYGDFSQYDLEENVMFRNKNTPESIMEVQHTYTQGGLTYTSNLACVCTPTRKTSNGVTTFDGVSIPELGSNCTTWAAARPNVFFSQGLQTKMGKDLRKAYNMAWEYDGHAFNSVNTRPWMGPKFWCLDMQGTADGNNYKVFRYADALLMMAECYNELGDDATAVGYLNLTRNRAGLGDYTYRTSARLQDEIRNERARELFGEFQRKFDLVRWGIWYQAVTDYSDYNALVENLYPCREYYPIPDKEVVYSGYALDNNEYQKYGL